MDENKFKAIVEEAINKAVEPVKEQLNGVVNRLDGIEGQLNDSETGLVALNNKLGDVEERLGGVIGRLDDPDTGLKRINDRLDSNTRAIMELETTVKGYGDMYKMNDSNPCLHP